MKNGTFDDEGEITLGKMFLEVPVGGVARLSSEETEVSGVGEPSETVTTVRERRILQEGN